MINKLIGISFNNRKNKNKRYRFRRFNNQSKRRRNYFKKGKRNRNNKRKFKKNNNNYRNNKRFKIINIFKYSLLPKNRGRKLLQIPNNNVTKSLININNNTNNINNKEIKMNYIEN